MSWLKNYLSRISRSIWNCTPCLYIFYSNPIDNRGRRLVCMSIELKEKVRNKTKTILIYWKREEFRIFLRNYSLNRPLDTFVRTDWIYDSSIENLAVQLKVLEKTSPKSCVLGPHQQIMFGYYLLPPNQCNQCLSVRYYFTIRAYSYVYAIIWSG